MLCDFRVRKQTETERQSLKEAVEERIICQEGVSCMRNDQIEYQY